jgi:hypothetical protein
MRHPGSTLFAVLLFSCGLYAQAPKAPRALVYESEAWIPGVPLDHTPDYSGGMVVSCNPCRAKEPILFTIDRQSRRDELVFELKGSGYVSVEGIAAGPDGALAVAGYGMSGSFQFASFIAWISPDRKRQIVNRTWPFFPYAVTVAPDGTIWAVGPVKGKDASIDLDPSVLRHYDPSGSLLATATVNAKPENGSADVSIVSNLMASSDRIGWLTRACEYIEFSFDAKELGRYDCPPGPRNSLDRDGIALSANSDVVLGAKFNAPFAPLELNRAKRTWDPVEVPGDARDNHLILGFDGQSLVTESFLGGRKIRRFNWGGTPPAAGR